MYLSHFDQACFITDSLQFSVSESAAEKTLFLFLLPPVLASRSVSLSSSRSKRHEKFMIALARRKIKKKDKSKGESIESTET